MTTNMFTGNSLSVKSLRFKVRPLDLTGSSLTWPLPFIFSLIYYNFFFSFLSVPTFDFSSFSKVLLFFVRSHFITNNTQLSCLFKAMNTLFHLSIWTWFLFVVVAFYYFPFQKFEMSLNFLNSNRYLHLQYQVHSKLRIAVNGGKIESNRIIMIYSIEAIQNFKYVTFFLPNYIYMHY